MQLPCSRGTHSPWLNKNNLQGFGGRGGRGDQIICRIPRDPWWCSHFSTAFLSTFDFVMIDWPVHQTGQQGEVDSKLATDHNKGSGRWRPKMLSSWLYMEASCLTAEQALTATFTQKKKLREEREKILIMLALSADFFLCLGSNLKSNKCVLMRNLSECGLHFPSQKNGKITGDG